MHTRALFYELDAAGININAICKSGMTNCSGVRMVVSDSSKALHLFDERNTLVVEDDVLMVEGANRPGTLGRIAQKLANARVNIDYCYLATSPRANRGVLILRVSDAKKGSQGAEFMMICEFGLGQKWVRVVASWKPGSCADSCVRGAGLCHALAVPERL